MRFKTALVGFVPTIPRHHRRPSGRLFFFVIHEVTSTKRSGGWVLWTREEEQLRDVNGAMFE
eukprot:CAMPEP_0185750706 /NCGR_PEP_ID=MMETSP1174-20130828/9482_1 /TAXON_ID=35687 /ORGANISM="Dictyocha speculum, Strain CCMP1381" /LENGTH=61 /DNA_ID=CAMNT_0028427343 /DNA_START=115 /DNA_END=300 /DNA_ORIENTATION=-